ncbi:signal peptidase II [Aliikangiella sp. G2MR2-5]|uniref:signal peptidase II n=1 Tax=Aliikangiella sp. G2MR2-5 TaxID=2788943 RepID=UPI0018A8DDA1|nr:signal peptidase II [Aliikangiella sp. G2MR2-5]
MPSNWIKPSHWIKHDLKPWQTGLQWLWVTLIFLIIDQATKQYAVAYFTEVGVYETVEVMPYFNFILRYNTGAAFSFLADQDGWQVFFFGAIAASVSAVLLIWLYSLPAKNRWLSIALCLIIAGALGNLYDRIMLGKVVDFIDWYYGDYHWPAFNIADSVIMLGAVMMLLDGFFGSDAENSEQKAGASHN